MGGKRARAAETAATIQHWEKLSQMNFKELRAKRESYANTMRSILNRAESEGRALTADETKDFDGLKAKIEAVNQTLDRASQLGEMRSELERPIQAGAAVAEKRDGMIYTPRTLRPGEIRMYAPNEAIGDRPYDGPGLGAIVRGKALGKWDGVDEEFRALALTNYPGVPTPVAARVINIIRNKSQVLNAGAQTVLMDSSTLKLARQTADCTAAWKAENAALTYSDATFDSVTLTAQMLIAGAKMSIELFEDGNGIDTVIETSLAQALALKLDYGALYGSGTAPEIKGIRNQTGVTVTDLGTNGYTLIDFTKFSAGIATLMGNNYTGPFSAIYSARTAGELDALKDTLNQPMRQPDNVAAMRKFISNQVPNNLTKGSANTASDAFLGQFDQAVFGVRTGLTLEVSRQAGDSSGSAFSNAQVWLRAYLRADFGLFHANAFNVLNGIL
jgi:HK97 family phage major capsid protein